MKKKVSISFDKVEENLVQMEIFSLSHRVQMQEHHIKT